jgi:hypothetical protein
VLRNVSEFENEEVPDDICKKNFGGEVGREAKLQTLRDEWALRKQKPRTAATQNELDPRMTQRTRSYYHWPQM